MSGSRMGDRYSGATLKCLPFYVGAVNRAADAFLVEQAGPSEQNVKPDAEPFATDEIARSYGWATDEWRADGLTFTVYSPFGPIPDPDRGQCGADARGAAAGGGCAAGAGQHERHGDQDGDVCAESCAAGRADSGRRPGRGAAGICFQARGGRSGGAVGLDDGKKTAADTEPFVFMRWSASDGVRERYNPVHLLGSCPGFGFEVPAGKKYGLTIALGSYLEGAQTNGMDGKYLYARYYKGLGDVLKTALDGADEMAVRAEALDAKLDAAKLSDDQRFIISHATHSYYGSTQLLDVDGQPLWVVNEGEYCMMNTLDLAVDHVFWELEHNPWLVRNLLDEFVRRYSYTDEVKVYKSEIKMAAPLGQADPSQAPPAPDEAQLTRPYDTKPGGLSFCHDMGAHNNFSPKGRSSYELANLTGCFSYMTQEQLCNWILVAGCYVAKTRDVEWLKRNKAVVEACLESMINRGGDVGFAQYDSTRTAGGQEITTYDSLDHSLAQTRNNVYIAVKSWASYRALALLFRELGAAADEKRATELAVKVAGVVARPGSGWSAAGDLREGESGICVADFAGGRGVRVPALLCEDGICRRDAGAGVRERGREAHVRRAERAHAEAAARSGEAESVCRWRHQAVVDEQQLVDEQDFDLHARDAESVSSGR